MVVSPAADGSVVKECARVASTCGDGGGGESVGSADVGWCVGVVVVSVSELTELVVSPAVDSSVVEECAGVAPTSGNSNVPICQG